MWRWTEVRQQGSQRKSVERLRSVCEMMNPAGRGVLLLLPNRSRAEQVPRKSFTRRPSRINVPPQHRYVWVQYCTTVLRGNLVVEDGRWPVEVYECTSSVHSVFLGELYVVLRTTEEDDIFRAGSIIIKIHSTHSTIQVILITTHNLSPSPPPSNSLFVARFSIIFAEKIRPTRHVLQRSSSR